jgi:MSHA biogenesis protein MshK
MLRHRRQIRLALRHGSAALTAALVLGTGPVYAESLADPTRPPDFAGAGGSTVPSGPVLQSVLISPERSVAVIDGETIPLGGRYGSATLVRISETGVELREGGDIRRLRLFPGVERRAVTQGPAASGAAGNHGTETKDKP